MGLRFRRHIMLGRAQVLLARWLFSSTAPGIPPPLALLRKVPAHKCVRGSGSGYLSRNQPTAGISRRTSASSTAPAVTSPQTTPTPPTACQAKAPTVRRLEVSSNPSSGVVSTTIPNSVWCTITTATTTRWRGDGWAVI